MSVDQFDYESFFGDSRSPELNSNKTSLSPSSETENEFGIASTPQMNINFDDTVLDLNNFELMPLNENNGQPIDTTTDFDYFSSFLNENDFPIPEDVSTFEKLFTNFGASEQSIQELSPSSTNIGPVSPTPSISVIPTVPKIINCVKVAPIPNILSTNTQSITLEQFNGNPTIRIVKTTAPLTGTNPPIIRLSPIKAEESLFGTTITEGEKPPMKRRRSESPNNNPSPTAIPKLTLEQLRLQYGNMNDEALKKHLRMIKNRESASLSRKRRKDLMENLDVQVKTLTTENEQLKKENTKLLHQIQILKAQNQLLKQYPQTSQNQPSKITNSRLLMGVVVLVVFNCLALSVFNPSTPKSNINEIEFFNGERAIVPSRTILSQQQKDGKYPPAEDPEFESNGLIQSPNSHPSYPYIQCVAFINKTHSKRINQDLHSLIEEYSSADRELVIKNHPLSIPPSKIESERNDVIHSPPPSRRISLRHQQSTRQKSIETNHQLEPYKKFETYQDDFIQSINRKNDTVYFVSFKRDHLIIPATSQNQTQRPKMSIILPASIANLNKSIEIPQNHIPMIKIDCEVDDTQLVFVKQNHIPLSYRHDLLQYYSSASQTNM